MRRLVYGLQWDVGEKWLLLDVGGACDWLMYFSRMVSAAGFIKVWMVLHCLWCRLLSADASTSFCPNVLKYWKRMPCYVTAMLPSLFLSLSVSLSLCLSLSLSLCLSVSLSQSLSLYLTHTLVVYGFIPAWEQNFAHIFADIVFDVMALLTFEFRKVSRYARHTKS